MLLFLQTYREYLYSNHASTKYIYIEMKKKEQKHTCTENRIKVSALICTCEKAIDR